MHPDWLGNPQHFVAGFVLAAALIWAGPRISITNAWMAAAFAVGVVMIGEALVELVEYPLKYSGDPNLTAYFDTLSDLANSLAGAVVGSAAGTLFVRRYSRRSAE
jgi:hypothetical protein